MTKEELLKAAKPVLFNTDMVRAILEGRKTVTRRVVKYNVDAMLNSPYKKEHPELEDKQVIKKPCMPPYQPNDILYVRETWQYCCRYTKHSPGTHCKYCYKASNESAFYGCIEECGEICNWRPSIHMPKEAARIWLRVTDVRVERLQEITLKDVIKEGIDQRRIDSYRRQLPYETNEYIHLLAYSIAFRDTWNSTIKKKGLSIYSWDANPWVWVIAFERCEKPEEV